MQLLQKHLTAPFNLSLINLGATNFKQDPANNGGGGGGPGGGASTITALFNRHANRRTPANACTDGGGSERTATDTRGRNGRAVNRSDGGSSEGDGKHSSGSEEGMQYECGGRDVLQTYGGAAGHAPGADAGGARAGAAVDLDEARRAAQQSVALRRDYSNSPQVGVRAGRLFSAWMG